MVSILSGFKNVLSGSHAQNEESGSSTVEKLVERIQSTEDVDSRRDAVRALKSLSKKFKYDVGICGMDVLTALLHEENTRPDLLGYALDTLANVVSCDLDDDVECTADEAKEMGERFTEYFIRKQHNVALVLSLLEEKEFNVRWPAVRFLTNLLRAKSREVQEILLVNPGGIPKLVDLLEDSREVVRNDALLLLSEVTQTNANIQKIVAYETAFERLFNIIADEGDTIVVEDCLYVMLNLLKNNPSNQQLFKENSLIQRITPFLDFTVMAYEAGSDSQMQWSPQKVANTLLLLQCLRTLISPLNSANITNSCQKVMAQCGLLRVLCNDIMASGVPADVLAEAINTVAEAIRGQPENQEYFVSLMAPSDPPRPALVILLMSMVNEKQPFPLRHSILYAIQSFLYKFEAGRAGVVQTLLPSTTDARTAEALTVGLMLCRGLLGRENVTVWLSAVALMHCILDSLPQKEQLLRVQLATSLGSPPISLLQHCSELLIKSTQAQVRIAILMLLCSWLSNCPSAVIHFLHNSANVPFLTGQISSAEGEETERMFQGLCALLLGICIYFNDDSLEKYNRVALTKILQQRVGVERFVEKLEAISKSESYIRAAQRPQLKARLTSDLVFDYEFTKVFKSLETDIVRAVMPSSAAVSNGHRTSKMPHTVEQHESIVAQYKDLIKQQDSEVRRLLDLSKELEVKNSALEREVSSLKAQLKAQNDLASVSLSDSAKPQMNGYDYQIPMSNGLSNESTAAKHDATALSALAKEYEQLANFYRQQNDELRAWVTQLYQLQQQGGAVEGTVADSISIMQKQISELDTQLQYGWQAYEGLAKQIAELQAGATTKHEAESPKKEAHSDSNECAVLSSELELQKREYTSLKHEQEDLLVLLADQDQKMVEYRRMIRALGGQLPESEEPSEDERDQV